VFEREQRGILQAASQEITGDGLDACRLPAKEVVEQVHQMNGLGKNHAAVVAGAFEAAEIAPEHAHPAKSSRADGFAQPLGGGIEPENMTDLEDALLLFGEFGQAPRLARNQ